MTKLLLWTAKLMIGTLLVSSLTLCFTWLTIRTYVDKLLASYNIEAPDTGLADLLRLSGGKKAGSAAGQAAQAEDGSMAGQAAQAGDGSTAGQAAQAGDGSAAGPAVDIAGAGGFAGSGSGSADGASSAGSTGSAGGEANDSNGEKDRVQSLSSTESGAGGASLAMTSKELVDLKERMSATDKAELMALLTKMPEKVLQELTALLEGGLTQAELAQMKERTGQYLSPKEYGQLMDILNKYE